MTRWVEKCEDRRDGVFPWDGNCRVTVFPVRRAELGGSQVQPATSWLPARHDTVLSGESGTNNGHNIINNSPSEVLSLSPQQSSSVRGWLSHDTDLCPASSSSPPDRSRGLSWRRSSSWRAPPHSSGAPPTYRARPTSCGATPSRSSRSTFSVHQIAFRWTF